MLQGLVWLKANKSFSQIIMDRIPEQTCLDEISKLKNDPVILPGIRHTFYTEFTQKCLCIIHNRIQ